MLHRLQTELLWMAANNTCYKNNLDNTFQPGTGSVTASTTANGYFVNNISVAFDTTNPAYEQIGTIANINYFKNLLFGSSCNFTCSGSNWISADPQFVAPPYFA